jgi:DNA replication and repair protein RecF
MQLLSLAVSNFRNLEQVEITPSPHTTIAVGRNGQGKTNLLEALYFLTALKPLRAGRLSELIRFGQPTARVSARFRLSGAEREVAVDITPTARQAMVDGKRASSLEDYFGGVSVVAFTPDDLEVVKGGPEIRRNFLDRAVFNRFPGFLRESREYLKAVKSRNRLLKIGSAPEYLDAFDQTLSTAGARVWIRRRALLAELAPRAQAACGRIGGAQLEGSYVYSCAGLAEPSLWESADEVTLSDALREALSNRLERDRDRGFTSVGPHADDLILFLGDKAARAYASQGQQRAMVLAWKVAEMENLEKVLGRRPLLLLDDVSSELDPERNAFLMSTLVHSGAQVLITTTDDALVSAAAGADSAWYDVREGKVLPRTSTQTENGRVE